MCPWAGRAWPRPRAAPPQARSSAGASPPLPPTPAQTGQRCLRTPVLMAAVGRRTGGTPSFLGPAPHRSRHSPAGPGPCVAPGPLAPSPSTRVGGAGPGLVPHLLHSLLGVGQGTAKAGQPGGSIMVLGGPGGYRNPGKASCSSRMVTTMSPAQSSSSSQMGREPVEKTGRRMGAAAPPYMLEYG